MFPYPYPAPGWYPHPPPPFPPPPGHPNTNPNPNPNPNASGPNPTGSAPTPSPAPVPVPPPSGHPPPPGPFGFHYPMPMHMPYGNPLYPMPHHMHMPMGMPLPPPPLPHPAVAPVPMMPGMPGMPGLPLPIPGAVPVADPNAPTVPLETFSVYLGKIMAGMDDSLITSMLTIIGKLLKFKRMLDPKTNLPKGFGFAEFIDLQDAARTLRIFKKINVKGRTFVVNIDQKTKNALNKLEEETKAKNSESSGTETITIDDIKHVLTPDEINNDEIIFTQVQSIIDEWVIKNNIKELVEEEEKKLIEEQKAKELEDQKKTAEKFLLKEKDIERRRQIEKEKEAERERREKEWELKNKKHKLNENGEPIIENPDGSTTTITPAVLPPTINSDPNQTKFEIIEDGQVDEYSANGSASSANSTVNQNNVVLLDRTSLKGGLSLNLSKKENTKETSSTAPVVSTNNNNSGKNLFKVSESDDGNVYSNKKIKLTMLDEDNANQNKNNYMDEVKKTGEDNDSLPEDSNKLFQMAIKWPIDSHTLKRTETLVSEAIENYVGEPLPDIANHINDLIKNRCDAQTLISNLRAVFDLDEAVKHAVSIWRILVRPTINLN